MSLSLDMVNGGGRNSATSTQAVLTQMIVTLEDAGTFDVPLTAIATLMTTLTLLMLLPVFVAMMLAVARAIRCRTRATALATCARN